MIPLLGLILGIVLGLIWNLSIPLAYSAYVAVVILALLDAIIGGITAELRERFSAKLFLSGLAVNAVVALLLTALGEQINFQLSLVPVFAFGTRIFQNLAMMRRLVLRRREERRKSADAPDPTEG